MSFIAFSVTSTYFISFISFVAFSVAFMSFIAFVTCSIYSIYFISFSIASISLHLLRFPYLVLELFQAAREQPDMCRQPL